MKEVVVLSRNKAKTYSALKNIPTTAIISIYTYGDAPNRFFKNPQIKAIGHWQFDDVEDDNGGITQEQANQIAEFVKRWENEVDTILVHCDAGISRSSGIGAAILFWKYGDDSQIFDDGTYCPNKRCYRCVMRAFGFDITYSFEDVLETKMEKNLLSWQGVNPELVDYIVEDKKLNT